MRRAVLLLHLFLWVQVVALPVLWLGTGMSGVRVVEFTVVRALSAMLQLVHSLPALRAVRERFWRWTFAGQAALTFGPHLALGAAWASGGSTAASALLLLRRPWSWLVFGLVILTEGAIQLGYGSLDQMVTNVVDGTLVIALATFALSRLVDILDILHKTRAAMAGAVARQERLRAAREVFGLLHARLSTVVQAARSAREVVTAVQEQQAAAAHLGSAAREALADTRAAAAAFRQAGSLTNAESAPDGGQARGVTLTPSLAFVIVILMSVTGALASFTAMVTGRVPAGRLAMAALGLAVLVGLQVYHGAPRPPGLLPPARWWTLSAQAVLAYVPIAVFGAGWIGMTTYLAACVLVVLRGQIRWWLAAVIAVSYAAGIVVLAPVGRWWTAAYFLADSEWTVLIFTAPMWLASLVVELNAAQAALTRLARVRQRLDIARDIHDLLASSLSAIALKADLAGRLVTTDPGRAGSELAEATVLAERTMAEAGALSADRPTTTLADEIVTARSVLAAAGVRADIRARLDGVPPAVDPTLAVVLREAVTNVLRHSTASHCRISLQQDGQALRLRVSNDGVAPGPVHSRGMGIDNLHARVTAVGGEFTAMPAGSHRFLLVAEIPARPAGQPDDQGRADGQVHAE